MPRALKTKIAIVLIASAAVAGAIAYVAITTAKNVARLNQQWGDYVDFAADASTRLQMITHHVRHGGFFQQYQDFISAPTADRMADTERSLRELQKAINELRGFIVSQRDLDALHALEAVISRYEDRWASVTADFKAGGAFKSDVDLSDKPAYFALDVLAESLAARSSAARGATESLIQDTVAKLSGSVVLIPVVLATGIFLVIVLRQLVNANAATEAAQHELDGLLEAAPDALITVNTQGRILRANAQAQRLFGYSRDEMVAMQVENLLPKSLRAAHVDHRHDFTANPRVRPMAESRHLAALNKSGAEFPVEISLSFLTIKDDLVAIASIRPVPGD